MRSPRVAAVAAFLSWAVLLTLSQTALAQRSPGMRAGGFVGGPVGGRAGTLIQRGGVVGIRRGMPGAFAHPFLTGFAANGFRRRFDTGFPAGPMLGPIGFGFPRGDGRFFGVPNGFGFFGFPDRRFGFFFFDGFTFFGRFPFFGRLPLSTSFFFLDGFPFFDGFPFVDGFPFFRGFPHRRFGLFGPHGLPVGAAPLGFVPAPWFGSWDASTTPSAAAAYVPDTLGARETRRAPDIWPPTLGRQLAVPGIAPSAGDSLVVERVSVMDVVPATVLRLTWRSSGLEAAQVALFLADTAQAMLVAQTLRAPPFTALFEPPPGTAFAGVTVVWPDGTTSSRLVPYRPRPR